jgi:ABC-type sulfate/molybdate transport systems ATPase subunit
MYARLGFSVAAHVEPEVLLVDEVLAVGDMAFQRKCYDRMLELLANGTTLILVSHNLGAVQKVCSRCIVLYRGQKAFDGSASEATAEYSNILRRAAAEQATDMPESGGLSQLVMSHAAVIEEVQMLRENEEPAQVFQSGERVRVRVKLRFNEAAPAPIFACTIRQPDGQIVYDFTTHWANLPTPDFQANTETIIEYPMTLNLTAGTYQVGTDLAYQDLTRYYDRMYRAFDFVITGKDGARGIADLKGGFRVVEMHTYER